MKLCLRCNQYFADGMAACPRDNSVLESVGKDPLIGALINDRYVVDSVIGKGSSGIVYKATRLMMGREVAVKVLHSFLGADSGSLDRVLREFAAASKLRHPHIITLWEHGITDDQQPYLVMDYLEGGTLADLIKEKKFLHPSRALPIVEQVCDALSEAHSQEIVHRDIKPENIVLEEMGDGDDYVNDYVKVLDFGIADVPEAKSAQVGRPKTVAGSPAYMSPEQCQGMPLDARSDIYSMAVMVFEMLTGERPFQHEEHRALMLAHVTEPPIKLGAVRSDLQFPDELETVISKALAKKPDARYEDINEFWRALKDACKGIKSPPPSVRPAKKVDSVKVDAFEFSPMDRLTDGESPGQVIPWGDDIAPPPMPPPMPPVSYTNEASRALAADIEGDLWALEPNRDEPPAAPAPLDPEKWLKRGRGEEVNTNGESSFESGWGEDPNHVFQPGKPPPPPPGYSPLPGLNVTPSIAPSIQPSSPSAPNYKPATSQSPAPPTTPPLPNPSAQPRRPLVQPPSKGGPAVPKSGQFDQQNAPAAQAPNPQNSQGGASTPGSRPAGQQAGNVSQGGGPNGPAPSAQNQFTPGAQGRPGQPAAGQATPNAAPGQPGQSAAPLRPQSVSIPGVPGGQGVTQGAPQPQRIGSGAQPGVPGAKPVAPGMPQAQKIGGGAQSQRTQAEGMPAHAAQGAPPAMAPGGRQQSTQPSSGMPPQTPPGSHPSDSPVSAQAEKKAEITEALSRINSALDLNFGDDEEETAKPEGQGKKPLDEALKERAIGDVKKAVKPEDLKPAKRTDSTLIEEPVISEDEILTRAPREVDNLDVADKPAAERPLPPKSSANKSTESGRSKRPDQTIIEAPISENELLTRVPNDVADEMQQEKLKQEALEKEKLEREKFEAEQARLEQERVETERFERERLEKERAEKERLEKERVEKERAEKERAERERAEKERVEKERAEKERAEKERVEKERAEKERAEKERAEKERADKERAEKERAEKERAEKERAEKERAEKERAEKERAEKERAEKEQAEKERAEKEKLAQEKLAASKAEKANELRPRRHDQTLIEAAISEDEVLTRTPKDVADDDFTSNKESGSHPDANKPDSEVSSGTGMSMADRLAQAAAKSAGQSKPSMSEKESQSETAALPESEPGKPVIAPGQSKTGLGALMAAKNAAKPPEETNKPSQSSTKLPENPLESKSGMKSFDSAAKLSKTDLAAAEATESVSPADSKMEPPTQPSSTTDPSDKKPSTGLGNLLSSKLSQVQPGGSNDEKPSQSNTSMPAAKASESLSGLAAAKAKESMAGMPPAKPNESMSGLAASNSEASKSQANLSPSAEKPKAKNSGYFSAIQSRTNMPAQPAETRPDPPKRSRTDLPASNFDSAASANFQSAAASSFGASSSSSNSDFNSSSGFNDEPSFKSSGAHDRLAAAKGSGGQPAQMDPNASGGPVGDEKISSAVSRLMEAAKRKEQDAASKSGSFSSDSSSAFQSGAMSQMSQESVPAKPDPGSAASRLAAASGDANDALTSDLMNRFLEAANRGSELKKKASDANAARGEAINRELAQPQTSGPSMDNVPQVDIAEQTQERLRMAMESTGKHAARPAPPKMPDVSSMRPSDLQLHQLTQHRGGASELELNLDAPGKKGSQTRTRMRSAFKNQGMDIRMIVLAVAVVLALGAGYWFILKPGLDKPATPAETTPSAALQSFTSGKFTKTIEVLEKKEKKAPLSEDEEDLLHNARYKQAEVLVKQKRFTEAKKLLKKIPETSPHSAKVKELVKKYRKLRK